MTNQCCNACDFCLRKTAPAACSRTTCGIRAASPLRRRCGRSLERRDLNRYHEVVFCGYGEPACRWDDMMWLCGRSKRSGSHFIRINTNGLADLITGRNVAEELDGLVDAVSVSLNASDAEGTRPSATARFGLEAFPAILKFTAGAVFNVPHVRMTVVSTMPKEEIDACKQVCERLGADFFVREYIEK